MTYQPVLSVRASVCLSICSIIKIRSSVAQQLLISRSSVSQTATFKRFLLVFFESFPYTIKYIEKDRVLKNFKSIIWNSGSSLMHDFCQQLHIYITIYSSLTFLISIAELLHLSVWHKIITHFKSIHIISKTQANCRYYNQLSTFKLVVRFIISFYRCTCVQALHGWWKGALSPLPAFKLIWWVTTSFCWCSKLLS